MSSYPFVHWFEALETRHLANLTFAEVRRAVQALSSLYVERRGRLGVGAALDGAGKRAAFAMFFAPLHFLIVREIVRGLSARVSSDVSIFDLGCGTGVAGAAWALEHDIKPNVVGIDRNAWALQEARWTYEILGVDGTVRSADVSRVRFPLNSAVIAAFTANELDGNARAHIFRHAGPVLIIEPIARRLTPWWDDAVRYCKDRGGREDEWRFRADLPERLALMDRAAGLNHSELTARSLWMPASATKRT